MAEAARAAPAHLHRGLPDEISIWEILVRLPPKALLRCRAVCPSWRRATSTRDFLLAHHARQPTLPLLNGYNLAGDDGGSVDIITFDHRAGIAAPDQLQSVARLGCGDTYVHPKASCDGLLIYSDRNRRFSICNPATRQYAPLPQLYGFDLLGMYRHSATSEYRLLLGKLRDQDGSYIFTLGSGQPPRRIGYPEAEEVIRTSFSFLFRGNLHWHMNPHVTGNNVVMVFDTTAELFRQMQAPAAPCYTHLFEMDDMLGLASFNYAKTSIGIWMMQDYESQVWAFKCRVELPVDKIWMHIENFNILADVVVMPGDGELLVLVKSDDWLHHVDINGKMVASFRRGGLDLTQFRHKQTLVPHTLFPTLQGYVVNGPPFI